MEDKLSIYINIFKPFLMLDSNIFRLNFTDKAIPRTTLSILVLKVNHCSS